MAEIGTDDPERCRVVPVLLEHLGVECSSSLGNITDEQGNEFHIRSTV